MRLSKEEVCLLGRYQANFEICLLDLSNACRVFRKRLLKLPFQQLFLDSLLQATANPRIVNRKLLCIPSTSASIERFFSNCGVICATRRGNMSHYMIIKRSLLKVDLHLLEKNTNKDK